MTDSDNQRPQDRAAETKRRRTRERFIQAADKMIQQQGLGVTAEAVASEAGLSVATFYTVFPSRGQMFTEVFRELVLGVLDAPVRYEAAGKGLTDYLDDLDKLTKDRKALIAGTLIARLETPAPVVDTTVWIGGESGGDVVLELAHEMLTFVIGKLRVSELEEVSSDTDRRIAEEHLKNFYAPLQAVQALALSVLDYYATANGQAAWMLAASLEGLFKEAAN